MHAFVRFLLAPITTGLVIGLVFILAIPHLRFALGQHVIDFFQPPHNSQSASSYALAVAKAAPAVVNISTRQAIKNERHPLFDDPLFRHFFNRTDVPKWERMSALGSGVIINREGYLLTNHHVTANADEIFVSLHDGRFLQATLIGSDPETDLAVLKIPANQIHTIQLGEPQKARIGDIVLAIGNPFNIGQTVTQGIISATGRHGLGLSVYENFIQTDAAINPGNSGGALIDINGHLLGINTAILNRSNNHASTGIGFAIPADIAVSIMNNIIASGEAVRGWLGIEARTINTSQLSGVIITGVYPNGPADKAGLQKGDILTHINKKRIGNGREGMNLIAQVKPNDNVLINILRNNQSKMLTATAGKRPRQL